MSQQPAQDQVKAAIARLEVELASDGVVLRSQPPELPPGDDAPLLGLGSLRVADADTVPPVPGSTRRGGASCGSAGGGGSGGGGCVDQRARLLEAPGVGAALDRLWAAVAPRHDSQDTGDDQPPRAAIGRDEYLAMHHKMVLALEPTTRAADATQMGLDDWARDSEGGERIDKARFCWSWLELAVLWTSTDVRAPTLEMANCIAFLHEAIRTLTDASPPTHQPTAAAPPAAAAAAATTSASAVL